MARTKDELRAFLRLQHEDVIRRGRPRLGTVTADSVELLVDLNPIPGGLWWECQQKAAAGTVMEGRVHGSGEVMTVESSADEMETDVRRADELVRQTNAAYRAVFKEAQDELTLLAQRAKAEDPEAIKRRLQDRLRKM